MSHDEQLLKTLDQFHDCIVVSKNGINVWVNRAYTHMFGYAPEEAIGRGPELVVSPAELPRILESYGRWLAGEDVPSVYETTAVHKDGHAMIIEISAQTAMYQGEDATIVVIRDRTERRAIERAYRESEARFRRLAETIDSGLTIVEDGRVVYMNDRVPEIFGSSHEELQGRSSLDFIVPEDRDRVIASRTAMMTSREPPMKLEFSIIHGDGSRRYIQNRYSIDDQATDKNRYYIVTTDLTERHRYERALLQSEELYRTLIENIQDGLFIIQDSKLIFVNESFARMVGYSLEEITGMDFRQLVAPESIELVADRYVRRQRGEEVPGEYEFSMLHADGTTRVMVNINAGIVSYRGKVASLGTVKDVTQRKLAENAIRESEDRYRTLFEQSADSIMLIEFSSRGVPVIVDLNKTAATVHGYATAELIGQPISIIDTTVDLDVHIQRRRMLFRGDRLDFETVHRRRDGSLFPMEVHAQLVTISGKHLILSIQRDISVRKRIEEAMKSNLKEKELLLREIHHRVKNNMQMISSLISIQGRRIPDPAVQEIMSESRSRIRSMILVHEKLYNDGNLAGVNMAEYVSTIVTELQQSSIQKGDITVSIHAEPLMLAIDQAIPCGLIINELVANAFKHAFPEPGEGEDKIWVYLRCVDQEVELLIGDNGRGIQPHGGEAESSGIGLELVRILVEEQLGGVLKMTFESITEFRISFPLLEHDADQSSDPVTNTDDGACHD